MSLSSVPVTVYDAANFQGGSCGLGLGRHNYGTFGIKNDALSSIRVQSGAKVTLYENADFSGRKMICVRDIGYVGDAVNDKTSSLVVEVLGTPSVIIYQDGGFQGWSQELGPGRYDGGFGLGNDSISSVIVPDGYRVRLYANGGFSGQLLELYADAGTIPDLNDRISSIIVEKLTAAPAPTASQLNQLIQKVAPRVYFHPDEAFLPSSVEWFLQRATLKGTDATSKPASQGLPAGGGDDGTYWLELPSANRGGDLGTAVAYVNAKCQTYWIDLQFWFFYPYNGAGNATVTVVDITKNIALDPMGEHGGDWEHATFRVELATGNLLQVYLAQHSGGKWFAPSDFATENGASVVYASRHGHASYNSPGDNLTSGTTASELGVVWFRFGLRNDTQKSGNSLDCRAKYQIIGADFLGTQLTIPDWRNFCRRWGPHITYDRAWLTSGVKAALGNIPVASTKAADAVMNALPDEFKEENGPTSPWCKGSWSGGE